MSSAREVTGGTRSGWPAASTPMRSAPSRVARRRRSGQPSCCTWATTTRSHSSPLERWAVSSRTAAPRTPRSASVSAGSCWATTLAKNAATPTWSRWSTARDARSKRATIASRSRWARRAPGAGDVDLAAQPLGPRRRRPQVPEQVLDARALGQHPGAVARAGWRGRRPARRRDPRSRRGSPTRRRPAAAARARCAGHRGRPAPSRGCGGGVRARGGRRRRGRRAATAAATRRDRGRGSRESRGRRCRG